MKSRLTSILRRAGMAALVATVGASLTAVAAPGASAAGPPPDPQLAWLTAQSWIASGHAPTASGSTHRLSGSPATKALPADIPDPDLRTECAQQATASSATGWIKSRFESCFHQSQSLVLIRTDTGAEVGTLAFDEWILGFTYDGSRRVDFVPSIENIVVSTQPGYDAQTWSINEAFNTSVTSGPAAGLTRPTEEGRNDLLGAWDSTPQWTLTYTSDATQVPSPGSLLSTYSAVELSVSAPGTAGWSDPVSRYSDVRFDSAGTGGMKAQGTVFTDARVTFSLSLSDPTVAQSARHIDDALHHPERTFPSFLGKSIPGESVPLHRLTNKTQQNINNNAAMKTCKDVWGSYNGTLLNCDEFPFKTTYEGAGKGDGNYSARLIDAADNQTSGRQLGIFYNINRILDMDPFYVEVVS
jgi:hypothetical protein